MTREIHIREIDNGYIVTVKGTLKKNGERSFRFTEELKLLEDIGESLDKKVEIREK